jgi:voltage-gated potassium channel
MDARSERMARLFEPIVTAAALLVIPVLILQQEDRGTTVNLIGDVLDWLSWGAFATEAVVMLSIVPSRRDWLRSHFLEVSIVILTPPFIGAFKSVRLLKLLRLLWLFRLAPIAQRLFTAAGVRSAALLVALTAVAGGAAFAELEKGQTTANGIYWAITTMTTVGYGNPQPTNTSTKILAVAVILVGIGFVAVLTGSIAQRFLAPDIEEEEQEQAEILATNKEILAELREVRARLEALESGPRT